MEVVKVELRRGAKTEAEEGGSPTFVGVVGDADGPARIADQLQGRGSRLIEHGDVGSDTRTVQDQLGHVSILRVARKSMDVRRF